MADQQNPEDFSQQPAPTDQQYFQQEQEQELPPAEIAANIFNQIAVLQQLWDEHQFSPSDPILGVPEVAPELADFDPILYQQSMENEPVVTLNDFDRYSVSENWSISELQSQESMEDVVQTLGRQAQETAQRYEHQLRPLAVRITGKPPLLRGGSLQYDLPVQPPASAPAKGSEMIAEVDVPASDPPKKKRGRPPKADQRHEDVRSGDEHEARKKTLRSRSTSAKKPKAPAAQAKASSSATSVGIKTVLVKQKDGTQPGTSSGEFFSFKIKDSLQAKKVVRAPSSGTAKTRREGEKMVAFKNLRNMFIFTTYPEDPSSFFYCKYGGTGLERGPDTHVLAVIHKDLGKPRHQLLVRLASDTVQVTSGVAQAPGAVIFPVFGTLVMLPGSGQAQFITIGQKLYLSSNELLACWDQFLLRFVLIAVAVGSGTKESLFYDVKHPAKSVFIVEIVGIDPFGNMMMECVLMSTQREEENNPGAQAQQVVVVNFPRRLDHGPFSLNSLQYNSTRTNLMASTDSGIFVFVQNLTSPSTSYWQRTTLPNGMPDTAALRMYPGGNYSLLDYPIMPE